jgi:hypothetical protein
MSTLYLFYVFIGAILIYSIYDFYKQNRRTSAPSAPIESKFIVRISDNNITCTHPDGKELAVRWDELQKVEVITTSEGPVSPDVFWVLHGKGQTLSIPQGATGERAMLEKLQALPGFDNKSLIEAMSCTTDRRFPCWEKRFQS